MINLSKMGAIYFSLVLSLIAMIIPLPQSWQWVRPEWVTLALIYWVFREPERVGMVTGWLVGLLMDLLGGNLLGQTAAMMVVVVYLARLLRNRLRFFPFWQQAFVILVLVGIGKLTWLLVQWLMGHPPRTLLYWSSTVFSVLLWPWFYRIMQSYERKMAN